MIVSKIGTYPDSRRAVLQERRGRAEGPVISVCPYLETRKPPPDSVMEAEFFLSRSFGQEQCGPMEEQPALNEIFSLVYEELKRLASYIRRAQPGATMNTTALVHEAWLKLQHSTALQFESEAHFKAIAARAMRQILVDAARRNEARKRGGAGEAILITLDETVGIKPTCDEEVLALDAALKKLQQMNPRQAAVVECRFFGSMSLASAARALDVSEATVERDWRAARAWLGAALAARDRKSGKGA